MNDIKSLEVVVIVVTYNAEQWLDKCFSSILDGDYPCRIIAVDNGSKDNTVELIQQKFPDVELHVSEKNLGFGQGNNWGIQKALDGNADYVFLLNQDAWIEKNTIKNLINCSKLNPNYGIISPIHLNGEYTALDENFKKYISKSLSKELVNKIKKQDFSNLEEIYTIDFVNAAAWFMPTSSVEKVGGFDPIFFHYGEDFNYLSRMKYFGYKIGLCPQTTICHDRLVVEKNKDVLRLNNSSLAFVSDINKNIYLLYVNELLFLLGAMCYNLIRFKPKRTKAFFSFFIQIIMNFKMVKISRTSNEIERSKTSFNKAS